MLERIEDHLRGGEVIDQDSQLVVRGWSLTGDGLKRNATQTSERYSVNGSPLVAVSAELTMPQWTPRQDSLGQPAPDSIELRRC